MWAGTTSTPTWNQSWNEGWNQGFNTPVGPSSQGGAFGTGFAAGQAEYNNRNRNVQTVPQSSGGGPAWTGQGDRPVGWNGPGGGDNGASAAQQEAQRREQEARNAINSGYDQYFAGLDDIVNNGLPNQRTAQENMVQSQHAQSLNTLGNQQTVGLNELGQQRTKAETNQGKTLRDLDSNIRNLFQSGNVYLGAKGAADSSAANQYSYALTKVGSKERGDVTAQYADIQNDINGREFRFKETYNTEVNNLKEGVNQKINQIASWFAEQTNALKQAKAQGQLSKGQDLASLSQNLLNVALQQVQTIKQEASNRQNALQEWAMNNSTNINQLKENMKLSTQKNYATPQANMNGAISGGGNYTGNPQFFGNATSEDDNRLFGGGSW